MPAELQPAPCTRLGWAWPSVEVPLLLVSMVAATAAGAGGAAAATSTVVVDVTDHGARGDGKSDDSAAIVAAVAAAAASRSRATVLFPGAKSFLTKPFNISSGLTLQVDGTIKGITPENAPTNESAYVFGTHAQRRKGLPPSCPPGSFPAAGAGGFCHGKDSWPLLPPLPSYGRDRDIGAAARYQALILAAHATDVAIVGNGTVDGSGPWWWQQHAAKPSALHVGRPHLIETFNCTGVEIGAGLTIADSPFWTLHAYASANVWIHHLTVRAPLYAPNTDGIDPDSCRNVLIEHCDISVGDDHVAIKAGLSDSVHTIARDEYPKYVTRNVTVRRNIMRTGMGVSIGSETSGGIEGVTVEDNMVGLCSSGEGCNLTGYNSWDPEATPCAAGICGWNAGLHVKTTMARGGSITGVRYKNNSVSENFTCVSLITNYQAPSVLPVGYSATNITGISWVANRCANTNSRVSLHCNANDTCSDVSVIGNTISSKHPWSFGWIRSFTVSGNSPPGALQCMEGCMNETNKCNGIIEPTVKGYQHGRAAQLPPPLPLKNDDITAQPDDLPSPESSRLRDTYTLAFRGGCNGTGERFSYDSAGNMLAAVRFNSSVAAPEALRRCKVLCSSNPCCAGLTLLGADNGGTHRCYTVNTTSAVRTHLQGDSYTREGSGRGCDEHTPPVAPAVVKFPIRGVSIACDLFAANRSTLYPGVNMLMEGAPAAALPSLARNGVAVLARRSVEAPFSQRSSDPCNPTPDGPCRLNTSAGSRAECIDTLAEQFNTGDHPMDRTGHRYSGVGLDEWTLANWTGVPGSGVPWPHRVVPVPDAARLLQAGYREGRRRYPSSFVAAWVAEGADDAFAELMHDGTFDVAMLEGYTFCWPYTPGGHRPCWERIDDQFPFLHWARRQGFINRTMFTFGWMVAKSREHPDGWTLPQLNSSMRRLKAIWPEMPGVLLWGAAQHAANQSSCTAETLAFTRGASELMQELWPDSQ